MFKNSSSICYIFFAIDDVTGDECRLLAGNSERNMAKFTIQLVLMLTLTIHTNPNLNPNPNPNPTADPN